MLIAWIYSPPGGSRWHHLVRAPNIHRSLAMPSHDSSYIAVNMPSTASSIARPIVGYYCLIHQCAAYAEMIHRISSGAPALLVFRIPHDPRGDCSFASGCCAASYDQLEVYHPLSPTLFASFQGSRTYKRRPLSWRPWISHTMSNGLETRQTIRSSRICSLPDSFIQLAFKSF